jgi:hypothetical protein
MSTTWLQFVAIVKEHLTVDANRRGIETYVLRNIKNAVVDLQRFIIPYRDGHTSLYTEFELDEHGAAQLGELPAGAKPKAIYFQTTLGGADNECKRNRMDWFDWINRQKLICGDYRCNPGAYFYAIGPMGKKFMTYPKVSADQMTSILVVWEGLKIEFDDADIVPWPDDAAEAVAFYVKAQINLNVNGNPQLAQINQALYVSKRLALWRDANEALVANEPDEEYTVDVPVPPVLPQFSPEDVKFLRTIATIEGAGVTAMVNIPTTTFTLPFAIMIQTSDYFPLQAKVWVLKTGSDAHSPGDGIVRPADFNAGSPRTWYLSN